MFHEKSHGFRLRFQSSEIHVQLPGAPFFMLSPLNLKLGDQHFFSTWTQLEKLILGEYLSSFKVAIENGT